MLKGYVEYILLLTNPVTGNKEVLYKWSLVLISHDLEIFLFLTEDNIAHAY